MNSKERFLKSRKWKKKKLTTPSEHPGLVDKPGIKSTKKETTKKIVLPKYTSNFEVENE